MAPASLTLSNHLLKLQNLSASQPPHGRVSFRISAGYATADRAPSNAMQTTSSSFYDVLGIHSGATCQEIKSAYRKLARVLHPDVASSNGRGDVTSSSADEFMRVHAAYATLSDPDKRAVYDSSLFRWGRRAAIVSASGVNQRRRTWETDQCW